MADIAHIIKQHVLATQQANHKPVYGHIASYNPATHTVRVIIPSMRDENGVPVLSPEMPFGTPGLGFQYYPRTGATLTNPTAGEQCTVGFYGGSGVSASPCLHYGALQPPPATTLPQGQFNPGDTLVQAAAGVYVHISAAGSVSVCGQQVQVGDITKTLERLVDERFIALFNAHTHPANGQKPTQQITDETTCCTTLTKAN